MRTGSSSRGQVPTVKLNERQRELLEYLDEERWKTPMDVGGRDGSHHSATLTQLANKGLAERKKIHMLYCPNGTTYRIDRHGVTTEGHPPYEGCRCKGHCRYRRTPAGTALIAAAENDNAGTRKHRR